MSDRKNQSSISALYLIIAALSGLLFGAGLYISQMIDPLKILRFLNFSAIPEGNWDPSLAFVMLMAFSTMLIATRLAKKRQTPLFDDKFHTPIKDKIDKPLIIGAVLFGIGWGMSGICPGPAIALVAFMPENLLVFLGMMFIGSYAGNYVQRWLS